MKVAYLTGLRELELREEPEPKIERPDEVLLRIDRVGVCGSDVHYYTNGRIGGRTERKRLRQGVSKRPPRRYLTRASPTDR